jgi:hypothetical protein
MVVYGCKCTVLLHFVLMTQVCPFAVQGETVIFFLQMFNAASLFPVVAQLMFYASIAVWK